MAASQIISLDTCDLHNFCTVVYVGNPALRVAIHLERETTMMLANAMLEEVGARAPASD